MRINFRQGIVSHQNGGFLNINPSGNVDLLANNRPITIALADRDTDYLYTENNTVPDAWLGPFATTERYWLYWDFNLLTFNRSFGITTLEPVAQSVEPGVGNRDVQDVVAAAAGIGSFTVDGEYILPTNKSFIITGSTGNNGTYTVASSTFNTTTGQTTIVANEEITSNVADGLINLDIDIFGNPLKTDGRHWYDTANNIHYVLNGSVWTEVVRLFACQIINGTTIIPPSITFGSFTGTQIGDTSSVRAGRVIFDESSNPIRKDNGTFFTTEDQFFANATRVDAIRLESNVSRAQFPFENAVAAFTVVAWKDEGKAQTAQYSDIGSTVLGILTEDVLINEVGAVVIQGVVTNPSWNWTTGPDAVPVGSPLWVDNGALVPVDPHVTDTSTFPVPQVPVARVLDRDTVVFEQGLGGKGERGPVGDIENLPVATPSTLGGVTLTTPSSNPAIGLVPSDLDPRLFDARIPLPHTHEANEVNFTPTAGITSSDVEGALIELANGKVNRSGDTMTGPLVLPSDPSANLQAATKQYVDSLVAGFVWLEPICTLNLISDNVTTPPSSPASGDTYIIPPSATGAWAIIPAGHVVYWDEDTTSWVDRGPVTNFATPAKNARFGVAFTSTATPSGNLLGAKDRIAEYDDTGTFVGFAVAVNGDPIPTANQAVYVCSESDFFAFNQFAYSGPASEWIQTGGAQPVTPTQADDITTELTGNILSVKQFNDGGQNDVRFWQGLEPTDLDVLYAPITHFHFDHPLPYDIKFFETGLAANQGNKRIGKFIASRNITFAGSVINVQAHAEVGPILNPVTYRVIKNGNTSAPVGEFTFEVNQTTPTSTSMNSTSFSLAPGDTLEVVGPATTDFGIFNLAVTLTGCTEIGECPTTSYVLSATPTSVDEGDSFTVTLTTNAPAGTLVPYTITGVSTGDIDSASLTGNFNVGTTDSITFNTTLDAMTEGTETFRMKLDNGAAFVDVAINEPFSTPDCAAGNYLNDTFWQSISIGGGNLLWTGTAWNVDFGGPALALEAIGTWTTGFRPTEARIKIIWGPTSFTTGGQITIIDTDGNFIGSFTLPPTTPTGVVTEFALPLTFTTFDIDRIEFQLFGYDDETEIRCIDFLP